MADKLRVLCWSDSVTVQTGFGVVSKYILKALHATNRYNIDQLAINFSGHFYSRDEFPYQIVPASMLSTRDPYGLKKFGQAIVQNRYDIVWILNDTFVVEPTAKYLNEARQIYKEQGLLSPLFVYYFPVDCKVLANYANMVKEADVPVAYTRYGIDETLKVLPQVNGRLEQIYHGVNTSAMHALSAQERSHWRHTYLRAKDSTFVIVSVNRNSVRKQIPHTLLAFKEFRKHVPDSVLYLHTVPKDGGIDLIQACADLGLSPTRDVIFPANYSPSAGFPEEVLNRFYNCGDVFLTTHLGEGFGLTVAEAMSTEIPVIAPDNTNMSELLGEQTSDEKRGWLYPCKDLVWVDNSGYRPVGRIEDIVAALMDVYEKRQARDCDIEARTKRARRWCLKHDWENIGKQWVELFSKTYNRHVLNNKNTNKQLLTSIL